MASRLTLAEALESDRLVEFIEQEERAGKSANRQEFDSRLERLIKAPRPAGRTSRSRARGGSRGK